MGMRQCVTNSWIKNKSHVLQPLDRTGSSTNSAVKLKTSRSIKVKCTVPNMFDSPLQKVRPVPLKQGQRI